MSKSKERTGKAPQLKAFQILAGAHVGPDFAADPAEVDTSTLTNPEAFELAYPPRLFKARAVGSPRVPGESNVVYSPTDLAKKFNKPNSERFRALRDAPQEIQAKFEEAFQTGGLSPRQSGVSANQGRPRRLSVLGGTADADRTPSTSEVGPRKGEAERAAREREDAGDVSPEAGGEDGDEEKANLNEMTVNELRAQAEEEGIEVSARATKDELVKAINKGRRAR